MPSVRNNRNEIIGVIGMLVSTASFFTLLFLKNFINGPLVILYPLTCLTAMFFAGYCLGGLRRGLLFSLGFLVSIFLAIIIGTILKYLKL